MPKGRKTFNVEEFKATMNAFFYNSADDRTEQRRGKMSALEGVLHASGNYKGFGYLNSDHMDANGCSTANTVGINSNSRRPNSSMDHDQLFRNTDETRVVYF